MKNSLGAMIGIIFFVLGIVQMAQAFPTTFFGQDIGNGESLRLSPSERINANAAQTAFLSLLLGAQTESFESFNFFDLAPLPLTFGTVTPQATLETVVGSFGFVSEDATPTGAVIGRYPTSGTKYWDVISEPLAPFDAFSVTFAQPQAAVGFFATDVGDEDPLNTDFDILLERTIGSPLLIGLNPLSDLGAIGSTVTFGSLAPLNGIDASGAILFFGIVDPNDPFTKVTFRNASSIDGFGIDDFTIASQVIPEPNTLLLLGSGLVLGGFASWRKKRTNSRVI